MNDLEYEVARLVANYPHIIADDVYNTVLYNALRVDHNKVNTHKEMIESKKKYMKQAKDKLEELEKEYIRRRQEASDSTERRRQTMAKLEVINSHKPRKSPGSFCPVGCSMMGGRSYKYRNMRKSSRNMRKSRRKSRK
jgi:hypothetical protein